MSAFDDNNPFGDPFSDPSITSATTRPAVNGDPGVDEYNPFANQTTKPSNSIRGAANPPLTNPEPAVINTSSLSQTNKSFSPPSYTPSPSQNISIDEIRRQKEELDRKEAELAAREERLRRDAQLLNKENNWPPLPSFCPFNPCFYQDINVEIPVEFQKLVRYVYYLWMFYTGVLFVNLLAGMIAMIKGVEDGTGIFAFSLVAILIFAPLSFVCWFRPLYKAFRDDSSFNFMVFFFVFFCQLVLSILWAIGIPGMGLIGLIRAISWSTSSDSVLFTIFAFLCAIVMASYAVASFLVLVKVHSIYRSSGASMQKAQMEFTQGVLRNEAVQQAATAAATGAARQAMNQQFGQNTPNSNGSGLRF